MEMSVFNLDKRFIFIHVPRTAGSSMERHLGLSGHHDIMFYKSFVHHLSAGVKWDTIFKFGFVRNPYDRFVSSYSHLGHKRKSFKKFVLDHKQWWYTKERHVHVLFKPQVRFLCSWGGTSQMDFIGRFENLNEDWEQTTAWTEAPKQLSWTNKSKHTKWQDYFDDETKAIVKNKYIEDFAKFYPEVE